MYIVRSVTYVLRVRVLPTLRCPKQNKLKPKPNPKLSVYTCSGLECLIFESEVWNLILHFKVLLCTKFQSEKPTLSTLSQSDAVTINFNDPGEHLIICSCGHPCLREWVGGFVLMVCHGQFSSQPKLYPTQNCPWG